MPSQIPRELKPITQFIRRAEELDKAGADPRPAMMSYFCRSYAMTLGLKLRANGNDGPTVMPFLMDLMKQLEGQKANLPPYTEEEGKDFVLTFAMGVFKKADDEDRAGTASKYVIGRIVDCIYIL